MADRSKKTIFVGGIADSTVEATLVSHFSTFGDVVDVQIPRDHVDKSRHRNFGFVVFGSTAEAEDAVDNMHLNELEGRIIQVNFARPLKTATGGFNRPIWEDEEWIKQYAKPVGNGVPDGAADEDPAIAAERALQAAADR